MRRASHKGNRRVVLGFMLHLFLWGAGFSYAEGIQPEDQPVLQHMAAKLTRGVVNLTTGWMEVPKQVYLVGRDEGWGSGLTRGLFDGFGMFGARTLAGAYEILTFPVPLPPQYQPMVRPEYVWQPEPAEVFASEFEQVTPAP